MATGVTGGQKPEIGRCSALLALGTGWAASWLKREAADQLNRKEKVLRPHEFNCATGSLRRWSSMLTTTAQLR
jgi:hypothetical protein